MESERGSKPLLNVKTHPANPFGADNLPSPGKILISSASSSTISSEIDSPIRDPIQKVANEPIKSSTTGRLIEDDGEKDFPSKSSHHHELSDTCLPESTLPSTLFGNSPERSPNNGLATQSPPVQVMERPSENAPYRIPSSVFARTKSTTPMEWSVTSNESLFSIHMGNMSFSRDQYLLMGRSGELGIIKSGELAKPGEIGIPGEATSSSPLSNGQSNQQSSPLSNGQSNQHPVFQTADFGIKGAGATEAAAAETMKEVLRENQEGHSEGKSLLAQSNANSASLSLHSDESANSINSFAFPILTGDGNNNGSVNFNLVQQQQRQRQGKQQNPPPKPHTDPQTSIAANKPATAKTSNWCSCFSCCRLC